MTLIPLGSLLDQSLRGRANTFPRGCLRTWPHTWGTAGPGVVFEWEEMGSRVQSLVCSQGLPPSWVEGNKRGDWLRLVLFGLPEPKAGARGQGASSGECWCATPPFRNPLRQETY